MPANTVRRAMLISSDSATVASTASDATTFKAFIEISSDKAIAKLEQCGVKINLKYPGHVTAVVPLTAVEAIQAIPEVTHINIASRVAFLNDSARAIGKVNEVQLNSMKDLPQAYKGEGVIIGVVDTGMEYYHRAFRDAKDDSKLRIRPPLVRRRLASTSARNIVTPMKSEPRNMTIPTAIMPPTSPALQPVRKASAPTTMAWLRRARLCL
jgi:hypothetical protein